MSLLENDKYVSKLKTHSAVVKDIPAGIYEIQLTPEDTFLVKKDVVTDTIVELEGSESDQISKEVDAFMSQEVKDLHKEYGVVYKKGFLLYGKAGTGKSVTALSAAKKLVEQKNAVVFFNPKPDIFKYALEVFKDSLEDRLICLILEEFETIYNDYPSEILSLLDGESQIKNFITIACTNYIEQLPERIKSRPSRFSTIMEIKTPSQEIRQVFVKSKLLEKDMDKLSSIVDATDEFTIDQVKDVIVSVCVFNIPISEAVLKIKEMQANSIGDENIRTHHTNGYINDLKKDLLKSFPSPLRRR